jgi:hypothetical protein
LGPAKIKNKQPILLQLDKGTWTSPDGKTHNQNGHILIDKRWHSNIVDI